MLLRNFDYATKYLDYISNTELEIALNSPMIGWYKFINGLLTALLVKDNNLYFLYGKEKFLITKSQNVLLKKKSNVLNEFSLIDQDKVLVKFV